MSRRRPQPVLEAGQAAAIATVATGLVVSWLARHGMLVPAAVAEPLADLIQVGIVAVVGAAASLWAALWARIRVTPAADPRNDAGTPLRPVDVDELVDQLVEHRVDHHPAPATVSDPEPRTVPIPVPVVDIAALRREYHLD